MRISEQVIEVVAQELAKAGGVSWHPGRTTGSVLRIVSDRYRDRARLAIAALERWRASQGKPAQSLNTPSDPPPSLQGTEGTGTDRLQVGDIVVYRPPGDKRAITCRVEELVRGRAYLVPCPRHDVGWVDLHTFEPLSIGTATDGA